MKDEPRVPTAAELARERREYGYHAARKTPVPTGALRVVRVDTEGWSPRRKSWYDRAGRPVEEQIPDILAGFLALALELKARRAERERQDREREEAERRRQELEARRQAHAKLIVQLETQAGAWYRARILRAYLRAMRRRAPGTEVLVKPTGETIDFLAWAERYVNAMDPLHDAPRTTEFEREEYSWRGSEHAKEELSRLSGHDWPKSWKVSQHPSVKASMQEAGH